MASPHRLKSPPSMAKKKPRPAGPMLNTNVGTDRAERLRALAARLTEERGGVVSITKLTKDGIDLILKQYGA